MDSKGIFSTIEDWATKGVGIYRDIKGAESEAEVKKIQYETQAEIEKAKVKKYLYFGMGLLGVALVIRLTKVLQS